MEMSRQEFNDYVDKLWARLPNYGLVRPEIVKSDDPPQQLWVDLAHLGWEILIHRTGNGYTAVAWHPGSGANGDERTRGQGNTPLAALARCVVRIAEVEETDA